MSREAQLSEALAHIDRVVGRVEKTSILAGIFDRAITNGYRVTMIDGQTGRGKTFNEAEQVIPRAPRSQFTLFNDARDSQRTYFYLKDIRGPRMQARCAEALEGMMEDAAELALRFPAAISNPWFSSVMDHFVSEKLKQREK